MNNYVCFLHWSWLDAHNVIWWAYNMKAHKLWLLYYYGPSASAGVLLTALTVSTVAPVINMAFNRGKCNSARGTLRYCVWILFHFSTVGTLIVFLGKTPFHKSSMKGVSYKRCRLWTQRRYSFWQKQTVFSRNISWDAY